MPQLGSTQLGADQLGSLTPTGTEWQITRNQQTVEADLYDVSVVDTANPFGNYAIAKIDDSEGVKFDQYPRGTRVDFAYREDGGSTINRFTGYVVERRETEQAGADALAVECYSFDQFLRRGTVTTDTTGLSIFNALKQIIQQDTPVSWDATRVTVGDDQDLTRNLRGEKVENAIQVLRGKSTGEEFGVTGANEFFFRPQETQAAPRDIDNTQWLNYDIPERGKRAVNEVTVWYNGGEESVTVANGADKQDLQDKLGTNDPITFSQEVTREDITDIDDARDVAESILQQKEPTLTGTVTTFGLYEAQPGDVISIEIVPRGINGDFRIAEVEYRWGTDETILTIVEKRGNQDDLLKNLSEDVKRVEMRQANRDAVNNRVTNTTVGTLISTTGDVDGVSFEGVTVTNTALNKLRAGWAGDGTISITEVAVGNGTTSPSRTQTSLDNELERVTVSESLPDSTSVTYTGSVSTTDIREIGLFDSAGDMVGRATIPASSLTGPVSVTYTLAVENDGSISRGVVTSTGQTSVRDILADNTPALPTQYAYGSDGSAVSESDTALGTQVVKVGIDEILVQSADTTSEWDNMTSLAASDPVSTASDTLASQQSCFTQEGEDGTRSGTDAFSRSDFSDGVAVRYDASGELTQWTFTPQYDIPAADFGLYLRWEAGSSPELWATVNGVEWQIINDNSGTSLGWTDVANDPLTSSTAVGYDGGDFIAGTEYTVEIDSRTAGGTDAYNFIDVIAPLDIGPTYTFDNANGGSSGYLDGPEFYPDVVQVPFSTADTRRTLQNATAEQSWNDISNNQYIELSNDGGATWITTTNSQTATAAFSSAETGVQTRIGLSRYGSRTTATPQTGFNGQSVSVHDLSADVDAITPESVGVADVQAIISSNTVTGSTLREAGELTDTDALLTRSVFADVDVKADQRIFSSEAIGWQNP